MSAKILSDEALELIASRFRLLGELTRLKLLQAMKSGERNVTDLVEATGGTQSNVSKHLAAMLDAGLIRRRKDGLNVFYGIADESVFAVCEIICDSLGERITRQKSALRSLRL